MNKSHKTRLINKHSNRWNREAITLVVEEMEKWADKEIKYANEHINLMHPRCAMCRKRIDTEDVAQIYFDWSSNKIDFLCSEKHDRSYRVTKTDHLTGFVGFCFNIHSVEKLEKLKPIVIRERHLKALKDTPWNDPVKLWGFVKDRVAEEKGEIIGNEEAS